MERENWLVPYSVHKNEIEVKRILRSSFGLVITYVLSLSISPIVYTKNKQLSRENWVRRLRGQQPKALLGGNTLLRELVVGRETRRVCRAGRDVGWCDFLCSAIVSVSIVSNPGNV